MNAYTAILIDPISKTISPIEFDGTWAQARTIMRCPVIETYQADRFFSSPPYTDTCAILDENGRSANSGIFTLCGKELFGRVIITGLSPSAADHAAAVDHMSSNPLLAIAALLALPASQHDFLPLDPVRLIGVLSALRSDVKFNMFSAEEARNLSDRSGLKMDAAELEGAANDLVALDGINRSKVRDVMLGTPFDLPAPKLSYLEFIRMVKNEVPIRYEIPSYDFGEYRAYDEFKVADSIPLPKTDLAIVFSINGAKYFVVFNYEAQSDSTRYEAFKFINGGLRRAGGNPQYQHWVNFAGRLFFLLENRTIDYLEQDAICDDLQRMNSARSKRGKTLMPTPKIIRLHETRIVRKASDDAVSGGRGGWEQPQNTRRGYHHYKSGKWVKPYTVNKHRPRATAAEQVHIVKLYCRQQFKVHRLRDVA